MASLSRHVICRSLLWHHYFVTWFVAAKSPFRSHDCSLGVPLFRLHVVPSAHHLEADGKVFTYIYLSLFISFITHLFPPSASLPTPINCTTPTAWLPSPLTASRRTNSITSQVVLRILAMPILITKNTTVIFIVEIVFRTANEIFPNILWKIKKCAIKSERIAII